MRARLLYPIIILSAALIFSAVYTFASSKGTVAEQHRMYIVGNQEQQEELTKLFITLERKASNPDSRFIVIQEITKALHTADKNDLLNLFLTSYVERHRDDPYNGYYLLVVARNYLESGAEPFAVHYFERILKNHTDLSVNDQSIHYVCLENLIDLVEDPELKVNYYKSLLSRFGDEIKKGPTYYFLAKTYEDLGEWELAIQAYRNFLNYPNTKVEGVPNAHEQVRSMIEFYDYPNKNWTRENLEDLVGIIKYAIRTRNISLLSRYRAKVNFFAVSWEEQKVEANRNFLEGLGSFMNQGIHYSRDLDRDSNAREAYLKTWGWSYRIKTWYLYFRKIHFPSNPNLHGEWEWAGIYFGEKPFAGAEETGGN
jgi:tetratricopeptide (TPR) repeat protein